MFGQLFITEYFFVLMSHVHPSRACDNHRKKFLSDKQKTSNFPGMRFNSRWWSRNKDTCTSTTTPDLWMALDVENILRNRILIAPCCDCDFWSHVMRTTGIQSFPLFSSLAIMIRRLTIVDHGQQTSASDCFGNNSGEFGIFFKFISKFIQISIATKFHSCDKHICNFIWDFHRKFYENLWEFDISHLGVSHAMHSEGDETVFDK